MVCAVFGRIKSGRILGSFERVSQASSSRFAFSGHTNVQDVLHKSAAKYTQKSSQITLQHVGKPAQTDSQQTGSAQLELPCGTKQSPAVGSPQLLGGGNTHRSWADNAQVKSQTASQQNGSMAHTIPQHVASAQDALPREMKQEPSPGIPQISHNWLAMSKQSSSQLVSQQCGVKLHTSLQHLMSTHPLPTCTAPQSPKPQPISSAIDCGANTDAINASARKPTRALLVASAAMRDKLRMDITFFKWWIVR